MAVALEGIKEEDVGPRPPGYPPHGAEWSSGTSSVISVHDLLGFFKKSTLFSSVVSKDVLEQVGVEGRKDASFEADLRFSARPDRSAREALDSEYLSEKDCAILERIWLG